MSDNKIYDSNRNELIALGKILSAHGVKGNVKAEFYSENNICDFELFLDDFSSIKLEQVGVVGEKYICQIISPKVSSCDDVKQFRNKILYAYRNALPEVKKDEYYLNDLIGLKVFYLTSVTHSDIVSEEEIEVLKNMCVDTTLRDMDNINKIDKNLYYLGLIDDVFNYGASDIVEVKMPSSKMVMLPFIKEYIRFVDIEHQYIIMNDVSHFINPHSQLI